MYTYTHEHYTTHLAGLSRVAKCEFECGYANKLHVTVEPTYPYCCYCTNEFV